MDVKISRFKFGEKEDVYITSEYLVTNYLLTTEGKIVMIKLRSLVDTILMKWLKLKLLGNGSWYDPLGRTSYHISGVPAKANKTEQQKKHNMNLIIRKHQINSNQGTLYWPCTDLHSWKMSELWKTKDWGSLLD